MLKPLASDLVLDCINGRNVPLLAQEGSKRKISYPESAYNKYDTISLEYCDWVPPSLPPLTQHPKLYCVQDNDAVIKMVQKRRCPALKHVARTHRINLDWLFERVEPDTDIHGRYIHTKLQIADMLTKGNFTSELWLSLCHLIRLGPPPKRSIPKKEK